MEDRRLHKDAATLCKLKVELEDGMALLGEAILRGKIFLLLFLLCVH